MSSLALVLTLIAFPAAAATVDGIPLHWSVSGSGPRTVTLIHGWTCDSTSWDAQVPALAKEYRVIALDLPGHGRSGSPADGKFSMELFARAVEAVRSEAGADKVVLVGHSMGAPVIREYAKLFPQRVAALVATTKVFPSFEYQEIPGTNHFLMMEKPDDFNRRLTTFLAKLTY